MEATATHERTAKDLIPSGQLVTFALDGVEFGFDIAKVQEIVQRSTITPVPGAPSFVIGVLNLRGSIIPVIDSRLRFHLEPTEVTARTRIIVIELSGQATGLQVDSVSEVVKLADFALRETPPLVAGVNSDYLAGMVQAGSRLITLINLDKILDSEEFGQKEAMSQNAAASAAHGWGEHTAQAEDEETDTLTFITFGLGHENFGLSLEHVEEIVELPQITKVPDAPEYVMGVICIRDKVLPLLNLQHMFEVEPAETHQQTDSMVILLTIGHAKLAAIVDGIQEIIRVRQKDILPTPQTLKDTEAVRLDGVVMRKDRMVSILRVIEILSAEDQAKLAAMGQELGVQSTVESEAAMAEDISTIAFKLGDEVYGLELHEVREIIMVGMITPVPRAPSFIQGVLNLRGEIIPVIDLRSRFGLEHQAPTDLSRIIVTPISDVYTGLIVDAVTEVKNIDKKLLEPPPSVTSVGANAYITKVARTSTGVVFLLYLNNLLTESENHQLTNFHGTKKAD
jgi:purine-binding chemotaxis protein CheW